MVHNQDVRSTPYQEIKDLFRPGHANFTYLAKYGIFDYRGGGRSSGRETVCRVIAGVVAKKLIQEEGISVQAYIRQVGNIEAVELSDLKKRDESPVYCPDLAASEQMVAELKRVKVEGDSVGAVVEFIAEGLPAGLGEPIYEKLQARLAYALMSLPATKGFEIGEGFSAAAQQGSKFNDGFEQEGTTVVTSTNYAGGTLGGISTGMPVIGRVAFKPTSSIFKPQQTLTTAGEKSVLTLPESLRLDPCVALRGVVVVEAMVAVVLADLVLMNRLAKL
jgi:chorismate synthase